MKIALIILSVLLIAVTIKYILYRRQIGELCRQLSFLKETTTNNRLTTYMTERELLLLAELINDIYDKHEQSELALRDKERRMKELIANVSHDIRTPLTSLKGYFELFMQEYGDKQSDREMQYAMVMNERMNTLNDLLDELFTYTKLQSDDYVLELSEYDITRLILDTLFSFYGIFKDKGIEPVLDINETSVITSCNEVAVKRVVANIIRNAMLHGTGDIRIKYGMTDGGVEFICSNRVANPDAVDVNMVFDRFYKADKARNKSSTGLGLAIARELVERMGGSITARIVGEEFEIRVGMVCDKCFTLS